MRIQATAPAVGSLSWELPQGLADALEKVDPKAAKAVESLIAGELKGVAGLLTAMACAGNNSEAAIDIVVQNRIATARQLAALLSPKAS